VAVGLGGGGHSPAHQSRSSHGHDARARSEISSWVTVARGGHRCAPRKAHPATATATKAQGTPHTLRPHRHLDRAARPTASTSSGSWAGRPCRFDDDARRLRRSCSSASGASTERRSIEILARSHDGYFWIFWLLREVANLPGRSRVNGWAGPSRRPVAGAVVIGLRGQRTGDLRAHREMKRALR
jgi:hypothetical protein